MSYKTLAVVVILLCTLQLAFVVPNVFAAEPGTVEEEIHPTFIIRHLGPEGDVDRYEVVLRPGATLFDIAVNVLPMLPPKDAQDVLQAGYGTAYPEKSPDRISIGDTFVFEVPLNTFVARTSDQKPNQDEFISFAGDHLTWYPMDSPIRYRMVKAAEPDMVYVAVNPDTKTSPNALAQMIWGWDVPNFQPDYIQVRAIADLLRDPKLTGPDTMIRVNPQKRYLDPLRNYQSRAITVENGLDGAKIYDFDPADPDVPFIRVEDRINGQTDLESLSPGVLRVTYLRTGQIQEIRMTGFDEFLRVINRPEQKAWADIYSRWASSLGSVPKSWNDGTPSDLAAYPSAKRRNSYFTLESDRLLVLTFDPKPPPNNLVCLGRPLLISSAFLLGIVTWRRRHGRWLP